MRARLAVKVNLPLSLYEQASQHLVVKVALATTNLSAQFASPDSYISRSRVVQRKEPQSCFQLPAEL